jgi:hypothetical protein
MNGNLCAPAILYVGFSLTQIIIDTFKGFYDVAFFKSIVMIVFTIVLNALCSQGLGIISWLIVFLPFIMMTYITAILMITLGFGNNSTDTKNKVVYPSDYPKVLHVDRQPNIHGIKDQEHTVYNDGINDTKKGNDLSSDPNNVDEPVNLQQPNDVPKPSNKND